MQLRKVLRNSRELTIQDLLKVELVWLNLSFTVFLPDNILVPACHMKRTEFGLVLFFNGQSVILNEIPDTWTLKRRPAEYDVIKHTPKPANLSLVA